MLKFAPISEFPPVGDLVFNYGENIPNILVFNQDKQIELWSVFVNYDSFTQFHTLHFNYNLWDLNLEEFCRNAKGFLICDATMRNQVNALLSVEI